MATLDERNAAHLVGVCRVRVLGGSSPVVVRIDGDLDIAAEARVREAIDSAWGTGTHAVLVDLTALSFMDSTGVLILLAARTTADATGRGLSLRLGAPARRVMELCGAVSFFDIES